MPQIIILISHLTCGGWYESVSSLRLLHMLEAVCLTIEPTDLREITIPSTRGVARFILEMRKKV